MGFNNLESKISAEVRIVIDGTNFVLEKSVQDSLLYNIEYRIENSAPGRTIAYIYPAQSSCT